MQSAKSFFNVSLYRKNLTRFWPIWGAYLVIWLLMPLLVLSGGWEPDAPLQTLPVGLILAFVFSIVSAMAVFSYLYNAKSVHLMHSLPIRREGLFLTNYLSGLSFLLLPQVLVFFLTLLAGGYHSPGTLVLWFVAQCLMCLFFYSFAVFCAMFTGNILALPVFYGVLNFLAAGLLFIITALLREFLFGFSGSTGFDELAVWLTPAVKLWHDIDFFVTESGAYILPGLPALLLYSLVGVVSAVAALFIYRKRRLETAGDLVSIRWVRPVFKYGVAFCTAVTAGIWFYSSFRSLFPSTHWSFLIPLLLWGAVGYFAADMLLKKNFRVFSKAWKGALCFSLVLVCAFVVTDMDLFGFNSTPSPASVASVRLYGLSTSPNDSGSYLDFVTMTDSENIDAVLKLHSYIADHKDTIRAELLADDNSYDSRWRMETLSNGSSLEVQYYDTATLYFNYTLTDGRVVRREYRVPLSADRLDDPGSMEAALTELVNRRSLTEQLYWGRQYISEHSRLVDASVDIYTEEGYQSVSLEGQADRDALLSAVRSDMAAGRIGIRYLFDSAERYKNCYYNDISFSFYQPISTEKDENGKLIPAAAELGSVTVTLQKTATETLKVLEELGYTDNFELVTWAEHKQREGDETYAESRLENTVQTDVDGEFLQPVDVPVD